MDNNYRIIKYLRKLLININVTHNKILKMKCIEYI